jgi:RNA polymerase sigma factor (TIGR02999 family)
VTCVENSPQALVYTCARQYSLANLSSTDTTQLLRAWADGDSQALQQLTSRVYRELRRVAAHLLQNERPGHTMQSSDLVHEVYLRLVNAREVDWQHRAHFFAVAATLMRRILLDRARRRAAAKRWQRAASGSEQNAGRGPVPGARAGRSRRCFRCPG